MFSKYLSDYMGEAFVHAEVSKHYSEHHQYNLQVI